MLPAERLLAREMLQVATNLREKAEGNSSYLANLLDKGAGTIIGLHMDHHILSKTALAFVTQVQTEILSRDNILVSFNLDKLGRLLELLDPSRP